MDLERTDTLGGRKDEVSQSSPAWAGMRIAVFGATGRTGRHILTLAQEKGLRVNALARHPEKLSEFRGQVDLVEGSVTDPVAVLQTVTRCVAVLSVLGPVRESPGDLLATASINVLAAMKQEGVKRYIGLTNTAVEDPNDDLPFSQRALRFVLWRINDRLARDSVAAAKIVSDSGVDWTLVRPAILTDGPKTGKYKVGALVHGIPLRISRADVAEFMFSCLVEGTHVRERPAVGGGGWP